MKRHAKKECRKTKKWLDKKGTQLSLVYYEFNMIDVNQDTCWVDFDSVIHVTNSLQGLQNLRKLVGSERHIYSGNKMPSYVEAIGTCKLVLSSGFISLEKTFYILGFARNLISVLRLVYFGYSLSFSDSCFSLNYRSDVIGYGTLWFFSF